MDIKEILKKYDILIKKEFDRLQIPFENYLTNGANQYKSILESMYSFYFITQYVSNNVNYEFKNFENELPGIITKIELNFWGIYVCLKNGAISEASIINRCMLESVVTLEFILKSNTKERLKLFSNFKHIVRWKQIQKHKKLDTEHNLNYSNFISEKEAKIYEEKFNEVKGDYNPNNPGHSWYWKEFKGNPKIQSLFEDLGANYSREYISGYSTHSNVIHGGSVNTDFYSEFRDDNTSIIVNAPKYDDSIINLGVISIDLCARALVLYLKYFKFDNLKDLEQYIDYFAFNILDKFTPSYE